MINPSDFLTQAQNWVFPHNLEVERRNAISRAYYSLYHESFVFLKNNYKSQFIAKIKQFVNSANRSRPRHARVRIDHTRLNALDPNYLKLLHINFHNIIPQVCKDVGGKKFYTDYVSKRIQRNEADYQINQTIGYVIAKQIVTDITNLISQLRTGVLT